MKESTVPSSPAPRDERELRLALVCYGGVSLAIYMHGVTKEIHKLVKASRALSDEPTRPNPFPEGSSERVYWNALRAHEQAEGVPTRVVVDIIAGTSAGGINGVFLAKALAHDLQQDALRELWMTKGDISELMDVPGLRFLPSRLRLRLRYAWTAARFLRGRVPLSGSNMSQWLYKALRDMDPTGNGAGGSLMPDGVPLDLFVTATDFQGRLRSLPITTPRMLKDALEDHRRGTQAGQGSKGDGPLIVEDISHKHVIHFRRDDDSDAFSPSKTSNALLAFAARATSSFPGAFPPVSVGELARQVGEEDLDWSAVERAAFRDYELTEPGSEGRNRYFVDGGVLNNFPFDHAIEAMRRKPADREVQRRLIYIQPDPAALASREPGAAPALIPTMLGSLSGIPRREPVVDDLVAVRDINERVDQLRDVIEANFEPVRQRVLEILPKPGTSSAPPSLEEILGWEKQIDQGVQQDPGLGYPTYLRLRLRSVVSGLADLASQVCDFPDASNHAAFVRGLMDAWADGRNAFEQGAAPNAAQAELLEADLEYWIRRLRFLVAGINWLYRTTGDASSPSRQQLDEAKRAVYEAIAAVQGVVEGATIPGALCDSIRSCFDGEQLSALMDQVGWAPQLALAQYQTRLDQLYREIRDLWKQQRAETAAALYQRFYQLSQGWPEQIRVDLLVRFVGFPVWDVIVYPIHAVGGITERDGVEVLRMSPEDAKVLEAGGAKAKLKGIALGHFGAFFDRTARENDYLWGRLDAAEILIANLLTDPDQVHTAAALDAVFAEERDYLTTVQTKIDTLASSLAARRSPSPANGSASAGKDMAPLPAG